jgi:hypothetical protein
LVVLVVGIALFLAVLRTLVVTRTRTWCRR